MGPVPTIIDTVKNIFKDDIAEISMYDFSRGNLDEESRIHHITTVASVCYANDKIIGKESLYNRLAAEAAGLPSSSFEFIPVYLTEERVRELAALYVKAKDTRILSIFKYGQTYGDKAIITNYRALLYDVEYLERECHMSARHMLDWYNTEEECEILRKKVFTFLTKMDMATSKQYNRHRVRLQELSRRYVSGKKVNFELYHEQAMLTKIGATLSAEVLEHGLQSIALYNKILATGVKPQSARRVIPVSMYTTIWASFDIDQVNNFQELRLDDHAQWEIRKIAGAMAELLPHVNDEDIYIKPASV